jgi:BirA family biotin operon repressor/biotin-[acetyl-CoA-carboxylase] ligase
MSPNRPLPPRPDPGKDNARPPEPPEPLGQCPYTPLACELEGLSCCREVIGFGTVDSTNSLARRWGEEGRIASGTVVLADEQTAGRGRIHHGWHSPAGVGIYASLYLESLNQPPQPSFLTLAAGLSVYEALAGLMGEEGAGLDIKWPNDILWKGRKISGILVESSVQDACLRHVVVGIGINVAHAAFPDDIRRRAVSLYQATGRLHSRHDVLLQVLSRLDQNLKVLCGDRCDYIRRRWEAASSFVKGRKVKFFEQGRPIMGTTAGLQPDGALVVETRYGDRVAVYSGEIFEY